MDKFTHKRSLFDVSQPILPVYINNRNRLTPLLKLVNWLENLSYVKIFIIDNDSTYPPLLDWYDKTNHEVFRFKQNLGHTSLWRKQIMNTFKGNWFVYSDSDIIPREDCLSDVLLFFKRAMKKYDHIYKVGFGLEINDIPDHYALKHEVIEWESKFWKQPIGSSLFAADIDTTFALYNKQRGLVNNKQIFRCGPALRTNYPYVARHYPWYIDKNKNPEEIYYLKHVETFTWWSIKNK